MTGTGEINTDRRTDIANRLYRKPERNTLKLCPITRWNKYAPIQPPYCKTGRSRGKRKEMIFCGETVFRGTESSGSGRSVGENSLPMKEYRC